MPSISTGKILVSGANGYIAAWVVQSLLSQGFAVRGTVRSASKGVHLSEIFKSYGEKFEVFVVEDIAKEGAFDEAVKGVDGIAHTASPFNFKSANPDDYILPAVSGTIGILKSATENGESIKRIVVTSSVAAVNVGGAKPQFTDQDWNEVSLQEVKIKGGEAHPLHMYCASKTLAEKAAWEYYDSVKGIVGWDLTTVLPAVTYGPILHEVRDISEINQSVSTFFKSIIHPDHNGLKEEGLVAPGKSWGDVRDVAETHTRAFIVEYAKDRRFFALKEPYCFQDFIKIAHGIQPSISNPFPDAKIPNAAFSYDTTNTVKILGMKYRTKEETMRDVLEDFKKRGWIAA